MAALVLAVRPLAAETISSKRIRALRQLHSLKKITVGPDDQFQAAVDPSGGYIVFAHKADLVTHLRLQDLKTGQVIELLPLDADSQDASFSSSGRLAFTYYKFNARGDICWVNKVGGANKSLSDRDIQCLQRPANQTVSERSSPFWRSEGELGYVVRDINTQNTRIIVENIKSHVQKTIAEGKVWAPTMKPGGRFLAYIELSNHGQRALVVRDLQTGEVLPAKLDLPGLSGFSTISDDERYLYFSHFLDDSNQDSAIDGRDHAVVFRVKIDQLLSGSTVLPEQLTSVESSCSFPKPHLEKLFLTCAFEDALDIYQLPTSGAVPTEWDRPTLENALKTSRSYQERLLILNNLESRFKFDVQEDLIFNHILADEITAGLYYLEKNKSHRSPQEYEALKIYLEARQLKKAQPPGESTRLFREAIANLQKKLEVLRGKDRLKQTVRAHLTAMLGENTLALKQMNFIKFGGGSPIETQMERYLHFQLAEILLARDPSRLLLEYSEIIRSPALSEESKIYYAFNALRAVQGWAQDSSKRVAMIRSLQKGRVKLSENLNSLLESEIAVLQLIGERDDAGKMKQFRRLDEIMRKARGEYFLRKAMNVRAVLNFSAAAEFRWLNAIAANWLRDTANSDTEFIYARQVVSTAALDQAYGYIGQKNFDVASGFFYQSLSLTDDLESHAGYIEMTMAKNTANPLAQRKVIDDSYRYLKGHQFIEDNFKFVEALLLLIDADLNHEDSSRSLDKAISKLESMELDRDSAVRYLLLGYCFLEKMRRTGKGVEFDNSLFQKAHRALMLAYDQGRENDRVRSAALMDLGILHQRVGNFGMSAKFLGLRKRLGFDSPEEQSRFAWVYSRSLFHAFQPELARRELAELPAGVMTPPFQERLAFYSTFSGEFEKAISLYSQLLRPGASLVQEPRDLARVYLSYGYALFKMRRFEEARIALRSSLREASNLKRVSEETGRTLTFEPVRIQLAATGLLSQMGSSQERLQALNERAEFLQKAEQVMEDWRPSVILNHLQRADLHADLKMDSEMVRDLQSAVNEAIAFGETNGYLGQAIFRTAINYLSMSALNPKVFSKGKQIQALVSRSLEAMNKQTPRPAMIESERLKLIVLWWTYQTQVLHEPIQVARKAIGEALVSNEARIVKEELPTKWVELERLSSLINY